MDSIYYEKVLNRIIQGRLRIKLGDLVLFIYEPTPEIIEESFDIYEEIREIAYLSGVLTNTEIIEVLLENNLWSPLDDREVEKIQTEIEDLKIMAYKSFVDKKALKYIKAQIRAKEERVTKLAVKKVQLDQYSCDGTAAFARNCWIIEKSTKLADGSSYNFADVGIQRVMSECHNNSIPHEVFRRIARESPFRAMWSAASEKSSVFNVNSTQNTPNQLSVISYAQMYDSVYSNPEAPAEDIINDDICLDGWFINQKREREKEKKQQQAEDSIGNEKIANSQEVFLMAKNKEHAQDIYGLNSPQKRQVIKGRQQQLEDAKGERVKLADLHDVKQGLQIDAVNAGRDAIKRR